MFDELFAVRNKHVSATRYNSLDEIPDWYYV